MQLQDTMALCMVMVEGRVVVASRGRTLPRMYDKYSTTVTLIVPNLQDRFDAVLGLDLLASNNNF